MHPSDDFCSEHDDQLRQKLWEYVYELLPADEAQEWTRRITSDPAIARLYAEIKLQVDRIGQALVHSGPALVLQAPQSVAASTADETDTNSTVPVSSTQDSASRRVTSSRVANLLVLAATLLLAAGWAFVRYGPQVWVESTSTEPVVLTQVIVPAAISSDGVLPISVETKDAVSGHPISAAITLALREPSERTLLRWHTNENGVLDGIVPVKYVTPGSLLVVKPLGDDRQALTIRPPQPQHAWVAHIDTDRLVYQPGDMVRFRGVVMDTMSFVPLEQAQVRWIITHEATGQVDLDGDAEGILHQGVVTGSYQIPLQPKPENGSQVDQTVYGSYRLELASPTGVFPPVHRRFVVIPPQPSSWGLDIELNRNAYRPADNLTLDVMLTKSEADEQALPETVEVEVHMLAGAETLHRQQLTLVPGQSDVVQWQMPAEGLDEPVFIEALATAGDQRAYRLLPVPMAEGKVRVDFFPEGGRFVTDIENRMYLECHDALGRPVRFRGEVRNDRGEKVGDVETFARAPGRGVCTWTPAANEHYFLHYEVDGYAAGNELVPVAAMLSADDVLLRVEPAVLRAEEPLRVRVHSKTPGRRLLVVVSKMNVPIAQSLVVIPEQSLSVMVEPRLPEHVAGVLRVTVFASPESELRPVAERLVFRWPATDVVVKLTNPDELIGGRPWQARLSVTDGRQGPLTGIAGVSIQPNRMLRLGLASVVADTLWAADVPLFREGESVELFTLPTTEMSPYIELLLGTRGWRAAPSVSGTPMVAENDARPDAPQTSYPAVAGQPPSAPSGDGATQLSSSPAMMSTLAPQLFDNRTQVAQLLSAPSTLSPSLDVTSIRSIGQLVLAAGSVSLLVFLVVTVWHGYVSRRVWLPSFAVATLVLVLSVVSVDGWWSSEPHRRQLAMAPDAARQASVAERLPSDLKDGEQQRLAPRSFVAANREQAAAEQSAVMTEGLPKTQIVTSSADLPTPPGTVDERRRQTPSARQVAETERSIADDPSVRVLTAPLAPGAPAPTRRRVYVEGMQLDRLAMRSQGAATGEQQEELKLADAQTQISPAGVGGLVWGGEDPRRLSRVKAGNLLTPQLLSERTIADPVLAALRTVHLLRMWGITMDDGRSDSDWGTIAPQEQMWEPDLPIREGQLSFAWQAPAKSLSYLLNADVHGTGWVGTFRKELVPRSPIDVRPQADVADQGSFVAVVGEGDSWRWSADITNRSGQPVRLESVTLQGSPVEISPANGVVPDGASSSIEVSLRFAWPEVTDGFLLLHTDHEARQVAASSLGKLPDGVPVELCWTFEPGGYSVRHHFLVEPRGYPQWLERFVDSGAQRMLESNNVVQGASRQMALVRIYPSLAAEVVDTLRSLPDDELPPILRRFVAERTLAWLDENRVAVPAVRRRLKAWLSARGSGNDRGGSVEPSVDKESRTRLDAGDQLSPAILEQAWLRTELAVLHGEELPGNSQDVVRPSDDLLSVALEARIAVLRGDEKREGLLRQLANRQAESGAVTDVEQQAAAAERASSGNLEATALATLAWSAQSVHEEFRGNRDRAIRWLRRQRRADGGFGSPRGTALALLALLTLPNDASAEQAEPQECPVRVELDAEKLADLSFHPSAVEPLVRAFLLPRTDWRQLVVTFDRQETIPSGTMLAVCSWLERKPASEGPYRLEVSWEGEEPRVGSEGRIRVRLEGRDRSPALLYLGLPAGVEPDLRQMPAGVQSVGRYLRWRVESPFRRPESWVRADDVMEFELPVRLRRVGDFTGPPSYVLPERARSSTQTYWTEPLHLTVRP